MFRDLAGDPITFQNRFLQDLLKSNGTSNSNCRPEEMTPTNASIQRDDDAPLCKRIKEEANENEGGDGSDHSRVRRQLFPDSPAEEIEVKKEGGSDIGSGSSSPIDFHSDTDDDGNDEVDDSTKASKEASQQSDKVSQSANGDCFLPISSQGSGGALSSSGPITLTGSARPVHRIVGQPMKRPSYKLIDLHRRVIGFDPPESHRAEDDCVTLARVFWLTPNAPLWADVNAVEFDRYSPLYTVRPRKSLPPGVFPSS